MAKRLEMRIEFKKCRARGHAWDDFIAPKNIHPTIYESPYQETLRCIRCECERFRGIGYTGEVETNVYDYPADYLMDKDDKPEIIAVRLSLLTELKAGAAQAKRARAHRSQPGAKRATPRKGTGRRAAPARRASAHA